MDKTQYKVNQFLKFHKLLMANAPKDYKPHYFLCTKEDKNPDGRAIYKLAGKKCGCGGDWKFIIRSDNKSKTLCSKCGKTKGSWKQPHARLNANQVVGFIKVGYNIGLAAMKNDLLILIDIDNFFKKNSLPFIENTLVDLSRKRCGLHGYYFKKEGEEIPNIPTDDDGEVRAEDQYVLVAGSFVPTTDDDINKEFKDGHITKEERDKILKDEYRGYYSIYTDKPCCELKYNDLPMFFREEKKKQEVVLKKVHLITKGKKSSLFDLNLNNIISSTGERFPHPLHPSDTGANFCVDANGLGHCWRHNVSLNAYQFFVVKSGYMSCCEAGNGHKGANPSKVTGDAGALFHGWLEAKKGGFIPKDDPIPIRCMKWLAVEHKLINNMEEWDSKDLELFNKVLDILEGKY